MDIRTPPEKPALVAAEEILRAVYGEASNPAPASVEAVAEIVSLALRQQETRRRELLQLYEKVVESVQLLSTVMDGARVENPAELQALFNQRLEAIRVVTAKTIETAQLFKGPEPSEEATR